MSDSDGKTEQATPRKREDARKDGQVARSEDLTNTLLFGLFAGYLLIDGARLGAELTALIVLPYQYFDQPFAAAAEAVATLIFAKALTLIMLILIATVVLSFTIQLIQIGPLFSTKSITPSLKKLNVVNNIKEIFSVNSLFDLIKMVAKTGLMFLIVQEILYGNLDMLLKLPPYGLPGVLYAQGRLMQQLVFTVFFVFAVMAVIDLFWQRRRLSKQLMMQKHEVKREHKENEGNPETKNFRRNLFREIVSGDMAMLPHASAVVANPTHLAVALYYKPPATGLPVIVVKGSDAGATQIFKAARLAGVPIIQNIGVARRLYQQAVFTSIPSDMIEAVAEIIVMARQIRRAAGYEEPEAAEEISAPDAAAPDAAAPDQASESGNAGLRH
ncbi:EscU/YscU/HrcU family type III secretion system export apparatus switch protein [Oxalobacteraceae bacterium CAVE-383]|nr:EscU/YscU/HrcU family type III secretion system export apparatus switch protein [Oxalobacteraceae bacterium CAVE-383]